jgi:anti-sigma regulatory factor (Ser/Thr protein kinase)
VPCGLRFGAGDLRQVRQVTAAWAARAGLPPDWADDFVIAVHEIAVNAVQHGSPAARLLLRVAGGTVAEAGIRDSGRWQPAAAAPADGGPGGMGLALAHRICDEVEIRAGRGGTTVRLRMTLPGTAGPAARRCRRLFAAGRARRPGGR